MGHRAASEGFPFMLPFGTCLRLHVEVRAENWSDGAKSMEKEAVVPSFVSTQDRCVDAAAFPR